jgi:hypothetical protein
VVHDLEGWGNGSIPSVQPPNEFAPDGRSYLEVSAEAIEAVLLGKEPKLIPVEDPVKG